MVTYFGKHRGTVVNNEDKLNLGRIEVEVPSVFGKGRSVWAMPCVPYAGPGVGFLAIPPAKARVWVEFEGGDPEYPIWVGGYWEDSADLPTSPPGAEKKIFRTESATLLLDDTSGSGGVTIETDAGMKITLRSRSIEIEDGSGAVVKLEGPTVSINGTGLEVT